MSQRFDFSIDVKSFAKELEALGNRAPAIMARVVNRANVAGKTAMVKAVSKDTGIQQKNIERELRINKATRSAPVASVEIRGRRIPLIAFKARGPEPSRGKGRGVSYTLPGGRGRVYEAFIATMPSGHRGAFKRPGAMRNRGRVNKSRSAFQRRQGKRGFQGPAQPTIAAAPRLPIIELFGPSLPHVFEKFLPTFEEAALGSFAKNMGHEISFARTKGAPL